MVSNNLSHNFCYDEPRDNHDPEAEVVSSASDDEPTEPSPDCIRCLAQLGERIRFRRLLRLVNQIGMGKSLTLLHDILINELREQINERPNFSDEELETLREQIDWYESQLGRPSHRHNNPPQEQPASPQRQSNLGHDEVDDADESSLSSDTTAESPTDMSLATEDLCDDASSAGQEHEESMNEVDSTGDESSQDASQYSREMQSTNGNVDLEDHDMIMPELGEESWLFHVRIQRCNWFFIIGLDDWFEDEYLFDQMIWWMAGLLSALFMLSLLLCQLVISWILF